MAEKKVTATPAAAKETVKEVVKKETAPKTTAKATTTEKPVEKATEKKAAEKAPEVKAPEKKPAAKKAVAKKPAVKKPAAKKTTAKKEVAAEVFVQFGENEVLAKDVLENAKNAWAAMTGKKTSDIKEIKLYIKPEEYMAYYVINGDTGSINI